MPAGVEVLVEDGFAIIDFTDQALRGPGLARLLKKTPPEFVEKLTRGHGPRAVYRVPEGNAREAGLLDSAAPYPDGEPSEDWKRPELDAYAAAVKGLDTTGLPNKPAVLDAIASAPK
jgi:hypothetical protein